MSSFSSDFLSCRSVFFSVWASEGSYTNLLVFNRRREVIPSHAEPAIMSQCTISNQGDADKLNSTSCSEVIIQGATGVLNLTTLQYAGTITVNNNLALEMLYFPQLISLRTLAITNATALTDVSLPVFSTSPIEFVGNDSTFEGPVLDLYISNAPKLSKFELKNFTSCGNLALFDTAPITSHFTDNITAAHSVQIDSYITFLNLRDVGKLEIFSGPGYDYQLSSLRSAGNITISNANSFFALVFDTDPYFSIPSVQINDSLILSSSAPPDPTFSEGQILFGRIVTVGQNLNASSMSDLYLGFEGLTYIGGDLSLVGNTNCTWNFEGLTDIRGDLSLVGNNNCTWNFDHVTSAGSLIILDNQYTTVPLFPKLQTVQNIHLRGVINTYVNNPPNDRRKKIYLHHILQLRGPKHFPRVSPC
jgi:hypothetical protein